MTIPASHPRTVYGRDKGIRESNRFAEPSYQLIYPVRDQAPTGDDTQDVRPRLRIHQLWGREPIGQDCQEDAHAERNGELSTRESLQDILLRIPRRISLSCASRGIVADGIALTGGLRRLRLWTERMRTGNCLWGACVGFLPLSFFACGNYKPASARYSRIKRTRGHRRARRQWPREKMLGESREREGEIMKETSMGPGTACALSPYPLQHIDTNVVAPPESGSLRIPVGKYSR